MNKPRSVAVVSGACMLVIGACAYMALAGEPAEVKKDVSADSLSPSSARNELLSAVWNVDDAKLDKNIFVAQAAGAGSAPAIAVQASNEGVKVAVSQDFSTWSDLTAIFRPSRWKNPLREGGSLSWLNYAAWGNAPQRTGEILLGEAIVAGATCAIVNNSHDRHQNEQPAVTTPAASSSSSSSDGRSTSSGGSSTSSGGSSTSSSGSSTSSSSGGSSTSSSSGELPFPGSSSGSSTSSSGGSSTSSSSGEWPF